MQNLSTRLFARPHEEDVIVTQFKLFSVTSQPISLVFEFQKNFSQDLLFYGVNTLDVVKKAIILPEFIHDIGFNPHDDEYQILRNITLLYLDFTFQPSPPDYAIVSAYEFEQALKTSASLDDFINDIRNTVGQYDLEIEVQIDGQATQAKDATLQQFFDKFKDTAKNENKISLTLGNFSVDGKHMYGVFFGGAMTAALTPVLWKENDVDSYQLMPINLGTQKPSSKVPLKLSEQELARLMNKYNSFERFMQSLYIPQHQLIERFIRRILRV